LAITNPPRSVVSLR